MSGSPGTADGTDLPQATVDDPEGSAGIAGELAPELAGLGERPIEEHPEVYEAIHERLGEILAGIEDT